MLTSQDVRSWFDKVIRFDVSKVDDETPLFSSAVLDSFTMMELVAMLEEKTGRSMPVAEVTLANLDTIGRVVAWAERDAARAAG
jgi:acyl carrier protein